MPEQLQSVVSSLASLGAKRLIALAAAGLLVFATIGIAAYFLNRPAFETLYVGLERGEVGRMGVVLGEAGIAYDVGSAGTSIMVPSGKSRLARMVLAEKGLPNSVSAGYELFDNLGSLGLTSFMQEVTRVRALEGEVARSIQTINGVRAARVHIVMSDGSNFRRSERKPTASVIVRTDGADDVRIAYSIRHLVAAAVPGLSPDNVTVLDGSGDLLAAGEDPMNNALTGNVGIEQMVEGQISKNIHNALAAYLGRNNFRANVRADINTDRRQIEETIFDPDSRIERSVQVVKLEESASQEAGGEPVTVEQNLPETVDVADGPASSEKSERREETTNYELSSKRIATVSNGYTVRRMSISVVVNRERLLEALGANATPEDIAGNIAEIEKVVTTAAGFDEKRGDVINVTAVDFIDDLAGDPVAEGGIMDMAGRYVGTLINAIAFVVVSVLVLFLGVKPLIGAVTRLGDGAGSSPMPNGNMTAGLDGPDDSGLLEGGGAQSGPIPLPAGVEEATADLLARMKQQPQERLESIVDLDEERSAMVLRRWIYDEAA